MTLEKVEPVDSQATIPSEIEVKVPVEGIEADNVEHLFGRFFIEKFHIGSVGRST